jgi:hypothetical protein
VWKFRFRPLAVAGLIALMSGAACASSESDEESGREHTETEDERSGDGSEALARPSGETGGEHDAAEERARPEGGENHDGLERAEGRDEHGDEGERGHEGGEEEGEESGVYIGAGETWDVTRRGARLLLSFDQSEGAFVGTVENTTPDRLCAVRVEVHLGDGPELGPTERTNLAPGVSLSVRLGAEDASFETWTAHPEMSECAG